MEIPRLSVAISASKLEYAMYLTFWYQCINDKIALGLTYAYNKATYAVDKSDLHKKRPKVSEANSVSTVHMEERLDAPN